MAIYRVKNNTESSDVWCGQTIAAGEYYTIEELEMPKWRSDTKVFGSVGGSDLVVNDGTDDFTDVIQGWNYFIAYSRKTFDDKMIVNETSRPLMTTICFSGEGDTTSDEHTVWGGNDLRIHHAVSDATEQCEYIDFNVMENSTYLHEGYIMWKDADFDMLCLHALPSVTPYTPDQTGTYYNLYGGYLIIPAAGDGTIEVDSSNIELVQMTIDPATGIQPPGYWNADYDSTTHAFSNITPANGDGEYNMFGTEIIFNKFANAVQLLGSGQLRLQTAESTQIGHGVRLRLGIRTSTEDGDHEWKASCILAMHRQKTA